jgi:hypothetical protein
LKPFCGQNIVIAVLSYEFDNSTSRRTESELTASKKVIVVVGWVKSSTSSLCMSRPERIDQNHIF